MKIKLLLVSITLSVLVGCATIPSDHRGYTIQSHTTIFGLDMIIIDYLVSGMTTPHIRLGYVTNDTQVVPEGEQASQEKIYQNVIGENDILSEQKVNK